MPRIYASDSGPYDFCQRCFPKTEAQAYRRFGLAKFGNGPDGRGDCFGYDCDHPDYDDDPDHYRCADCNRVLDGTRDACAPVDLPATSTLASLDTITRSMSAFGSFAELTNAPGYFPTIRVNTFNGARLADAYDKAQADRGDARRAYRRQ